MKNILEKGIVAVTVSALALGILVVPSQNVLAAGKKVSIAKNVKVAVGKTAKIKLKNNTKKVKWKITKGKKQIKITEKSKKYAVVKGVKKGTAKVQAVIAGKKYVCTVKVSGAKTKPAVRSVPKPQSTARTVLTPTPTGNVAVATEQPTTSTPIGNAPEATESVKPTSSPDGNETPGVRTIIYDGTNGSEIRDAKEPVAVVVKDSVSSIGESAFYGCSNMVSISICDDVVTIGERAFYGCSGLTNLWIPDSVFDIERGAFSGCNSLAVIQVSEGNPVYDSRNNCNAIIHTNNDELIFGCKNTVIPEDVTCIGEEAFSGCSEMTSITIPDSVTSIGIAAFADCSNLNGIVIPDGVTDIMYDAFTRCSSLTSVRLSNGISIIDNCVFSDCSSLTDIVIPDGVFGIGQGAFSGCSSLTSIMIPSGVTDIEIGAFTGCNSLTVIQVSAENPVYDSRNNCNAIIDSNGGELIFGCKNTVIPDGIVSIAEEAFSGCSELTSIMIPDSVTSIAPEAFLGCSGLTAIQVSEENPVYDSRNDCNAIIDTDYAVLIRGCKNTVIPEDVRKIGDSAFDQCRGLAVITIPEGVEVIEINAFSGCSELTGITIPDSMAYISKNAFNDCNNLNNITWNSTIYTSVDAFMEDFDPVKVFE